MAGTIEAQAHDAIALDYATAQYFKFRAGLKQEVADDEAAAKKASDEAVAKKAADEREKQWDNKMNKMMAMMRN